MSEFAQNLRALRKEQGMTQTELANALDISRSAVGMYENGEREPDFQTLEAIADFFNVDMNRLLGKSGLSREILENNYYIDDEVAELAQQIYEDPDKRILFSAARDISKEDMQFVIDMIRRLKGGE